MNEWLFGFVGLVAGALLCGVAHWLLRRRERQLAERLFEETQGARDDELARMIDQLKTAFSALSREALSANADDFLKLAKTRLDRQTALGDQTLEEKKKLIDARLEEMGSKLGKLHNFMEAIDKQRAESHGSLQGQLDKAAQATNRLQETTAQLREALANPQRRGQWGERMAEDVLTLAGFREGINYDKQQRVTDGGIPDFTFRLPGDRCVHMDVKFPLDNYLKVIDAKDQAARATLTEQFLRDVRSRIREVTSRAYIDPSAGTVDYVLVFIPNEQVYGFIHESDPTLLDDAMRAKVVLCSPLTLYAILAVIRQAVENFRFEQGSRRILDLLAAFRKQWVKYVETMDKVGRKIDEASETFRELVGVRTKQLDRQLDKIEDMQAVRELPAGRDDPFSSPPSDEVERAAREA